MSDLSKSCGCKHWQSERDIVALKCPCHETFHPCLSCHEEKYGLLPEPWLEEAWGKEHAVLCRACNTTMAIATYMSCESKCPSCEAEFNPGCKNHWPIYFDIKSQSDPQKS